MINTWNETFLHEELKEYFRGDTGKTEVPIDGSICDVVLSDGSIIEIQTSNLGKLKKKLDKLLESRKINLVYPIAVNTVIETLDPDKNLKSRRKSPKHGTIYQLFKELTGIWTLIGHPNLRITVVMTDVTETRIDDGSGSWRRKGVRIDNRKLEVLHKTFEFSSLSDYLGIIPSTICIPFTTKDLASAGVGRHAGYVTWVLTKKGLLQRIGKQGNAYVYNFSNNETGLLKKMTHINQVQA